jgi:hypothetical protein
MLWGFADWIDQMSHARPEQRKRILGSQPLRQQLLGNPVSLLLGPAGAQRYHTPRFTFASKFDPHLPAHHPSQLHVRRIGPQVVVDPTSESHLPYRDLSFQHLAIWAERDCDKSYQFLFETNDEFLPEHL